MPAAKRSQSDRSSDETMVTQSPAAVGAAGDNPTPEVKGAEMASAPADSQVAGGRIDGPILTSEPHREADKTSNPVPNDAQPEDPPVRTTRPDVPIVVSSATGAGQHEPPDPDKYHADGRPRLDES